jgi:hypothetical protein
MEMCGLPDFGEQNRLFTYKVASDRGSAPNPYGGVCTLAICKPRIRSVAIPGDVIAGFGCRDDSQRLVYVMVVKESVPWARYIEECQKYEPARRESKLPTGERHPGDCIWRNTDRAHAPRVSWSGHGEAYFQRDIIDGKNVLVGTTYWYFGRGDLHCFCLPENLRGIVPNGQGHRSTANNASREAFRTWFNNELEMRHLSSGILGEPEDGPQNLFGQEGLPDCRRREIESDEAGEEDGVAG